jgi:serine phosphatase RsbU (regulator of sigma subunit)
MRFGEVELLVDSAGQQSRIPVSKLPFTIGRGENCDAVIANVRVSRVHASLVQENGEYFIEDASSRHGTYVNGSRCDRVKLKKDDEITLGVPGVRILFVDGSLTAPSNAPLRSLMDSETSDLEKLKLFLDAARSLSAGLVINDVLRNMLDYALRLTHAERAFLYEKIETDVPALICGMDNKGNQISDDPGASHSVVREAMASASEFITADATQLSALANRESILFNQLRTVIAIPLRIRRLAAIEVGGVLYLDSHTISHQLSGVSHDVLRALASECAALLESAKLMEAEEAARQYHQEMEIAASIQRSLISKSEVECGFARISGRNLPCKEVGGDFFDIYVSPDALTVVVADVSGKGISAALLASVIHGMFYAQLSSGTVLCEAIASINKFLCSRVAGQKYATLLCAQLRTDGMLEIVNCGHVPALIAEGGIVTQVTDGDLPVGLVADTRFHSIRRRFLAGSRLCIVTDGISESQNPEGIEFGLGRVEEYLQAKDPVAHMLAAVESFCGHCEPQDDRTVIVLERTI